MDLLDAGDNLILLYRGWRYWNGGFRHKGEAKVYLISKQDGTIISEYKFDKHHRIIDILKIGNQVIFLSAQQLFWFDVKLQLLHQMSFEQHGAFVKLIQTPDGRVLVRTTRGVLELKNSDNYFGWWCSISGLTFTIKNNPWTLGEGAEKHISLKGYDVSVHEGEKELSTSLMWQDHIADYAFSKSGLYICDIDKIYFIDINNGNILSSISCTPTSTHVFYEYGPILQYDEYGCLIYELL